MTQLAYEKRKIQMLGTEDFETTVREGEQLLSQQHRPTAAYRLHEALQELSRRSQPEISGAIQHAKAALECVARYAVGSKDTLGQLIQRTSTRFLKSVDQVIEKTWSDSVKFGRHLVGGTPPRFEGAELMVRVSGVQCRYSARRAGDPS